MPKPYTGRDDLVGTIYEPGWCGLLSRDEAEAIAEACKNKEVRRKWGFRKRIRYPLNMIAERAYPENPGMAVEHIRSQQAGHEPRSEGSAFLQKRQKSRSPVAKR